MIMHTYIHVLLVVLAACFHDHTCEVVKIARLLNQLQAAHRLLSYTCVHGAGDLSQLLISKYHRTSQHVDLVFMPNL